MNDDPRDSSRQAIHCVVRGRIQGVGYRLHIRAGALSAGIVGWVRQLADGSMEIHAEGNPEQLAAFRAVLDEQSGYGRIASIETIPAPCEGCDTFEIRY